MARHKNPTALFDVIHSAKKPPRPSPSAAIPMPKWWGKNKNLPKPAVAESTENVGKQRSWLTAAKKNGVLPASVPLSTPVTPATPQATPDSLPQERVSEPGLEYWPSTTADSSAAEPVEMDAPPAPQPLVSQPRPRFIDRFKNRSPQDALPDKSADPITAQPIESVALETTPIDPHSELLATEVPAPQAKPPRPAAPSRDDRESFMRVDSAAGDIRFRMSYAGLIAIGFSMILAFAIVFLIGERAGQQASNDDSNASGPTAHTAGMMAAVGPAAPANNQPPDAAPKIIGNADTTANTDTPNTDTANTSAANTDATNSGSSNTSPVQPDVLSIPQHAPRPAPVVTGNPPAITPLPIKKTRDIGMMYVVVQSYPEQELAQKACDYMNSARIPCTLVPGPAGWAPSDWFSVVGLQPFNKHDPALPDYERSVRALGVKFTSRIIDQFQPQAYTWRADSDASQQP